MTNLKNMSSTNSFGIPDALLNCGMGNISNVTNEPNGWFIEADGCAYYVPYVVDNTTIGEYWGRGAGGFGDDWSHAIQGYIENSDCNANAIITFDRGRYHMESRTDAPVGLSSEISNIKDALGVSNNRTIPIGYSMSAPVVLGYGSSGIEEDNVMVLIDPKYQGVDIANTSEADLKKMAEVGTTLIVIEPTGGYNDSTDLDNYAKAAQYGVNVIVVDSGANNHGEVRNLSVQKGLFGILAGDETLLASSGWTAKRYENGNWVNLDKITDLSTYFEGGLSPSLKDYVSPYEYKPKYNFNDLTTRINKLKSLKLYGNKAGISNLFGLIKSNIDYVYDNMNSIRSAISSTSSIATSGISSTSTTMVPGCVADLLYEYLDCVISLLDKIAEESASAVRIAENIKEADERMAKGVEEPVEVSPTPSNPTPLIVPVTGDEKTASTPTPSESTPAKTLISGIRVAPGYPAPSTPVSSSTAPSTSITHKPISVVTTPKPNPTETGVTPLDPDPIIKSVDKVETPTVSDNEVDTSVKTEEKAPIVSTPKTANNGSTNKTETAKTETVSPTISSNNKEAVTSTEKVPSKEKIINTPDKTTNVTSSTNGNKNQEVINKPSERNVDTQVVRPSEPVGTNKSETIRNIGIATAASAIIGGSAYAGYQGVKKLKERDEEINEEERHEDEEVMNGKRDEYEDTELNFDK